MPIYLKLLMEILISITYVFISTSWVQDDGRVYLKVLQYHSTSIFFQNISQWY